MKVKLESFFFIFLLSFISISSFSQRFLALDKNRRQKRARFFVGDAITFQTTQSKKIIKGKIENIGDSITISAINYSVSDFYKIKTYPNSELENLLLSGAIWLPASAGVFLISEGVSTQLQGDSPLIEADHLKLTAGLFIGGFIMYKLSYRTFKIGKRHPLKIFDVTP